MPPPPPTPPPPPAPAALRYLPPGGGPKADLERPRLPNPHCKGGPEPRTSHLPSVCRSPLVQTVAPGSVWLTRGTSSRCCGPRPWQRQRRGSQPPGGPGPPRAVCCVFCVASSFLMVFILFIEEIVGIPSGRISGTEVLGKKVVPSWSGNSHAGRVKGIFLFIFFFFPPFPAGRACLVRMQFFADPIPRHGISSSYRC
jgi:hypothetical protein